MGSSFHTLIISDVHPETADAVSLCFDVPADLKDQFDFTPGQYLTLRTDIEGQDIRRSYSICSAVGEDLRVGIKQVPDGIFSSYAQTLKAGDTLQVMTPEGRFVAPLQETAARKYLLIGAGSGITPLLSIARSVLEGEPHSSVTLVFGNRQTASIMFREALEDLKDRFLNRFEVFHVLSRETQDVELFNGRISKALMEEMVAKKLIAPDEMDAIYLCGPEEMTVEVRDHFTAQGVTAGKVHVELFTPADGAAVRPPSDKARQAAESGISVDVILDGIQRSFTINDPEDTVLSAATKAGLDLPFSCAGGMCATCRCRVTEGAAEMATNYSLEPWEQEAGFVLSCQARPTTEKITLDFDAV